MLKTLFSALALAAITMTAAVQAEAASQAGTHLMWQYTPKTGMPYAVRHSNAACPNMPEIAK